jgi:hypothetical protein
LIAGRIALDDVSERFFLFLLRGRGGAPSAPCLESEGPKLGTGGSVWHAISRELGQKLSGGREPPGFALAGVRPHRTDSPDVDESFDLMEMWISGAEAFEHEVCA